MTDFLPLLLLKLLLVPSLIALVTLAGRRWGPLVAGWLSAFPIVAGPILLFIALEQGAEFAAAASATTLLAVLAILVFSIAYARRAHLGMPRAMMAALLAYALSVLVLKSVSLPLWAGFAAVVVALLLRAQPVGIAFLTATAAALLVQLGVKWLLQRQALSLRAAACQQPQRSLE